MNYDTFRIDRVNSGADKTTVWFTPEVPLPVPAAAPLASDPPPQLISGTLAAPASSQRKTWRRSAASRPIISRSDAKP